MEGATFCKFGEYYFHPEVDFLGAGDQANVYRAFKNGKPFALKLSARPELLKQEFDLLKDLKTVEGIVNAVEMINEGDQLALVLEYCNAKDLGDVMEAKDSLSERSA